MKKPVKAGLALACALALVLGTAVAAGTITTKQLLAQYVGIKLEVNGQEVTPKDQSGNTVEPFVVDGTTYLPVRAVGEALGKDVTWDAETKTISIQDQDQAQDQNPMLADAQQLISSIEASHPAFALDQIPEGYEAAKTDLLQTAQNPDASLAEFTFAAMRYTASLKDGHTRVDPFGGYPQELLEISWVADGDRLYLLDKQGAVTKAEVTKVGGLAVPELFEQIDRHVAAENQSAQNKNHANWSRYINMLYLFGAEINQDGTTTLTISEDGKETTRKIASSIPDQGEAEKIISTKTMGDVFYVDFNQCVPGSEVDAAAKALSQAVKNGTKKVIIDVRGNGGGDSSTCNQLLEAMGMAAPNYGVYIRYSPLAKLQRGYDLSTGGDRYDPNPGAAKTNPDIKLVVLTDERTFSSATMMGVFVRDGKLGTIIGRASSNAPNSYGDILSFTLSNSSLGCTVSHKQWLRPDESADPQVLAPDLETAVGEDSLEAALKFLA